MTKSKKKSHKKFNWKLAAFIMVGVVVALAITVQICFDHFIWQQGQVQSTFQMRTLIGEAIRGLTDIKSSPNENNQIPEVHLQLPPETDEVSGILYMYNKLDDYTDPNGVVSPGSEDFMVTTRSLSSMGAGSLNGATDMKTLFEKVPQAQSCVRGFTLLFEPAKDYETSLELAGIVNLQDKRTLYVYREPACQLPGVEELEKYLMQVQSY